MTIQDLLIAGGTAGFLIGLLTASQKVGCAALWIIPSAMVAYIAVWQALHPENIRSTSSLDFLFGPLWPSLGAAGGFGLGKLVRWLIVLTKRNGS